jgi:serine/threonine protein kinase/outer membrane protein assembly factor BamB
MFSRGDKLDSGHYTIIKEIGVGGMGVVYHCRDEQLLRDVAIKMLLPELMVDKSNLEVFRQEARLAARLEHPNVVTVYGIDVEERQKKAHHYVCMEYLPGGNLANRVIGGPLAVEHCLNWMKQLASGLTYAHKLGVVHQDIKADNIFITNEGDLKIGDFGLARLLVGRVHYNVQTKGMGTPAYMSPELCRGEPQDHRSDIYSLGVLFFEMATGQLPFRARGMIEMATKHSSAPIPSAKRINPLIPEILDKVIRRMMAKTPEERYSSMSEVLTILDDLIFELRVARLGLGNRPLLRSGNVQAELLAQTQAHAHSQAPPAAAGQQSHTEEHDGGWGTDPLRRSTHKLEKPHTTSLPPGDPGGLHHLTAADRKHLSPSEQLIAQLESEAAAGLVPPAPPPVAPHPTDTPVRSLGLGHFLQTQQVSNKTPPGGTQQSLRNNKLLEAELAGIAGGGEAAPPVSAAAKESADNDAAAASTQPTVTLKPLIPPPVPETASQPDAGSVGTAAAGAVSPAATPTPSPPPTAQTSSDTGPMVPPVVAPPTVATSSHSATAVPAASAEQTGPPAADVAGELPASAPSPNPLPPKPHHALPRTSIHLPPYVTSNLRKAPTPAPGPVPQALAKSPRVTSSVLPKMRHGPLLQSLKHGLDLKWIFRTQGPIGWSASPVLDKDEQTLYIGSADGTLYAIDTKSGSAKWSVQTGGPILSSPVLTPEKVLTVSTSGLICAVSVKDGSTIWRFDSRAKLVATPCLIRDTLVVPGVNGKLLAVETQGGLQRWQYKTESLRNEMGIVAAPQRHGDLVLFGTRGGELHAVSIDSGKAVWRFDAGSPIVASPAASVDSIYFGCEGGNFYALEAESGGLIWEYPIERPIVSRAAISYSSVLFGGHDKWLYCCERYDGSLKWKGALRGKVVANLVATRDTAISLTREGWIQAFATSNGEVRWQRDLGRSLESQPVITSDRFYLCTVEGEVIAYSMASAGAIAEKSA